MLVLGYFEELLAGAPFAAEALERVSGLLAG
jgi:hypothetical protein